MVDLQDRIPTQDLAARAGAVLLACAVATSAAAAEGETRKYPLPDKSTLELTVPAGWQDEARAKEGQNPAVIFLTPREGAAFKVFIIPVGRAKPDAGTAAQMRASVQQAADKVKPQVAEPILTVEEFKGAPGQGYYFQATDAAPKPEEFKYLSQGMLLVGEVVVSFGVLTNDGQAKVVEQAFAMLRTAAHSK